MSNGSKKKPDAGLDLVSPFIEVFNEVLLAFMEIFGQISERFFKWAFATVKRKYFGIHTLTPISKKHLKGKRQARVEHSLGFSLNNKRDFPLIELNTTKHTGLIGSTGSGKSVCLRLLIDHALHRGKPVIYFDPKASLESIDTFRRMCAERGQRLYLFTDIVEEATPFNPLLDGELDDISDRIINALDWSEPFYKNESIQALDDVLDCLKTSSVEITLKNVLEELNKHSNKKNIKGLINQLSKVNKSSFGKLLSQEGRSSLTFNKLRAEQACLYIGISSMGHSSSGHLLNKVFFGGLLTHAKDSLIGKVLGLDDPMDKPISVVFDELSSTIHEGFIDLQNKCRQAGMEITYATQGPSDIDRISPTLTSQIFENTNNLFVFNQIVPTHTEFFSRTFGTIKSEKKTHMIENDQRLSTGSIREVEEFLVHSNILRSLRVGQCVLFQRIPRRIDLLNIRHWQAPKKQEADSCNDEQACAVFQ